MQDDQLLSGSIADELAPASAPEVTEAVADFDGGLPDGLLLRKSKGSLFAISIRIGF